MGYSKEAMPKPNKTTGARPDNPETAPVTVTAVTVTGKLPGPALSAGVFLIWLACVAYYGHFQKPVSHNGGLGWDGVKYAAMLEQVRAHQPLSAEKPYAYRVATPWLAAHVPVESPRLAFHIVNLGSLLVTGWLLAALLSTLSVPPALSLFLIATFYLQWHAPLRQQFYDSFGVDAASQPFTCLILLIGLRWRSSESGPHRAWRLLVLSAAAFSGVFFRESVLFASLAVAISAILTRMHAVAGYSAPENGDGGTRFLAFTRSFLRASFDATGRREALPLLAGALAVFATHRLAQGQGNYSFIVTAIYFLYHKPLLVLVHAFFNGYGTALIPLLLFPGLVRAAWREYPILFVYPLMTFTLGWVAGGDTTRINYWGCFAVLPVMGYALAQLRVRSFGIGIFLLLEVVTTRMFFPFPDYPGGETWSIPILTGWGSDFPVFDLFSELANPRVLIISLAQYTLLTLAGWAWIRKVGRGNYLRAASRIDLSDSPGR